MNIADIFTKSFVFVRNYATHHKKVVIVGGLIILGAIYFIFLKPSTSLGTTYILAKAQKGTIVASVSGTGQVSVLNQLDIKPKVSGDVTYIATQEGQRVGAGQLLFQLDTTDAEKAVRDAEVNLQSAQLSLERTKQSTADIAAILENAFSEISNTFLDFPSIVSAAQEIMIGSTLNKNQDNVGFYKDFVGQGTADYSTAIIFINAAMNDYTTANSDYNDALLSYKSTSRYSDASTIQILLDKTLKNAKSLAQALKSEESLLDYLTDYGTTKNKTLPALITTYKNTLRTNIGLTNTHLSNLASEDNSIQNAPLDIKSQELSVEQRQNALLDAKNTLADYSVRAPFAGVVAKINVKRGDSASPGTAAATLIAAQQIAQVSLNEVDIAKIKLGEKATLTFDAVPDLTLTGEVAQIDTLGTISQGVVTYNVQIAFDTQDNRIKPGMSVSAAIITNVKQDVLLVPNGAVKSQGGASYVEVVDPNILSAVPAGNTNQGVALQTPPTNRNVEVGISDDTMTEIISGLQEGTTIVARTLASSQTQSQATNSGIRIPGLGGGAGGAFRGATGR